MVGFPNRGELNALNASVRNSARNPSRIWNDLKSDRLNSAGTRARTLLHSGSGFLGKFIGNAEIDDLADRARAETDPRIRHSLYRRVEEIIVREALLLPLFHDQVYCFARPEVEGLSSVSQGNPIVAYENLSIRR